MMPQDNKPSLPRPNRQVPVRLEAWLAASQPRLHPTQRRVLQAVADLTTSGPPVPSSTVRERLGLSQQLLNRHLRTLEAEGLVHLERPGAGLPLLARATSLGQRALGLRGPQPAARPAPAPDEPTAQPQPEEQVVLADPAPAAPTPAGSKLGRFVEQLYQDLAPHLHGLDEAAFRRLVTASAATALGRGPAPEAATAQPELPHPGPGPAPTAQPQVPSINPAEQTLEDRLALTTHPDHRGPDWWERTREFSCLWDQIRRRRLGILSTYFSNFGPRWKRPDWEHFNRARRQADARGARYTDWLTAQFERLAPHGRGDVRPDELHGDEAVQAWQNLQQRQDIGQGQVSLGPPPYTMESFNIHNPDHAAYAEELLDEIGFLASRVYGHDPDGPIRLLAQAVSQGTLPQAALDLRPQAKDRVLAALGRTAHLHAPALVNEASTSLPGVQSVII